MSTDVYRHEVATCLGLAGGSNDVTVAQKPSLAGRIARTWPIAVVGLGLVASLAWTVVLVWLTVHFALLML